MLSRIEKQLKRRFAIGSQVSEHSIIQDFIKQVGLPWEVAAGCGDSRSPWPGSCPHGSAGGPGVLVWRERQFLT